MFSTLDEGVVNPQTETIGYVGEWSWWGKGEGDIVFASQVHTEAMTS